MENSKKCNGSICKGKLRNLNRFRCSKGRYSYYCKKCSNYSYMIKRRNNRDFIDKEKLQRKECTECHIKVTEDTLCCFDFDHLDPSTKKYNISRLACIHSSTENGIETELKKCQLLCCKCHKKKTIKQLNYHQRDEQTLKQFEHININKEKLPPSICPLCNKNEKEKKATCCNTCYKISRRKVTRPPFEDLETEIAEKGYLQTGKDYGVTDNAVRKWIKWYIKHDNKQPTKIKIK